MIIFTEHYKFIGSGLGKIKIKKKMGNASGSVRAEFGSGGKLDNSYDLVEGKGGYAVLVGNGRDSSSGVSGALCSMDSALKKICHIDTQAPFLSSANSQTMPPPFSGENFDRLCRLLFDKDMFN